MSYGVLAMDEVPRLYNYEKCDEYFNFRTQKAGDPDDQRPLRKNRESKYKFIKKVEDGYALYLYNTPLITYKKDGRIELRVSNATTSVDFVNHLAPSGIRATQERGYLVFVANGCGYRPEPGQALTLMPRPSNHGSGWWEVVGAKQEFKRVAKRKDKAQIRKKLAMFETWADVCLRMGAVPADKGLSRAELGEHIQKILTDPENPENYGRLLRTYPPLKKWRRNGWVPYCNNFEPIRELAYVTADAYDKVPVAPEHVFIGRNVIWGLQ